MRQLISPNYEHDKFDQPTFDDLVDVFEDCWTHYIFAPCAMLLNAPYSDVAAVTLLCSYFEAIGGYLHGQDTNGRSKEFFCIGLCDVFPSAGAAGLNKGAAAIYKYVRCGVAHEGLLGHKVHYSREGAKSFYLTYPKTSDGSLDTNAEVMSIVLNAQRIHRATQEHFENYVRRLRDPTNQVLREAFRAVVTRQWNLDGDRGNDIGMTEDEFKGKT